MANLPVPSFMRYFHRFDGEDDLSYELRLRKQGVEFAPRTAEELALWTRFVEAALQGGQKPSTAVSWAIGLVLCRREVAEKGRAYPVRRYRRRDRTRAQSCPKQIQNRFAISCRQVLDHGAPPATITLTLDLIRGRYMEVLQVLCAKDHSLASDEDRHDGPLVVCEHCVALIPGVPDFSQLQIGQRMRRVDGEWITERDPESSGSRD